MAAVTTERIVAVAMQFGGLIVLAATLVAIVTALYRRYVDEPIPVGLAWLVGLSGVALYLNTTTALADVIGGASDVTTTQSALYNIAAFVAGGVGVEGGRRLGDRFARAVFDRSDGRRRRGGVGQLVRTGGRAIEVQLPDEVEDVVGYDPVSPETKADLAGRSLVFPRGLTVTELEERLAKRLRRDYAVGHVDVDVRPDGTVDHLALGRRAAGIGPTLPPSTTAVAVRADPAFAASTGDVVQVWETEPPRRVVTGELRGVADDVVTLVVDRGDTPRLDPTVTYRLVTLPVDDRPDREFASLLRAAEETFGSVTVAAGSPLEGLPVGALSISIVAVESPDGEAVAVPERAHLLAAEEEVYAVARPEALRRLETAATAVRPPSDTGEAADPDTEPDPGESTAEAGGASDGVEEEAQPPRTPGAGGVADPESDGPEPASDERIATAGDDDSIADDRLADEDSVEDEWGLPGDDGPPLGAEETADATEDEQPGVVDAAAGDRTAGVADGSEDDGLDAFEDEPELGPVGVGGDDEGPSETDEPGAPADEVAAFDELGGDSGEAMDRIDDEVEGQDEWGDGPEVDVPDDLRQDETAATVSDERADRDTEPEPDSEADDDEEGDEREDDEEAAEEAEDSEETAAQEDGDEDREEERAEEAADGQAEEADEEAETDGEDDGQADASNGEDDDDDDDGDDSSGGGTFAELKAEFEEGEADWAEDIDDSPGGDMRLDE